MIRHLALAIGLCLVACRPASPTPTPTPPAPTSSPSVASATPSGSPLDLVKIDGPAWVPRGPTAIVLVWDGSTTVYTAVPLDGSSPTRLLTVGGTPNADSVPPWDIRKDGSAMVLALGTPRGRRVAIVDFLRGTKDWLTAAPQVLVAPIWSYDGDSIYFGTMTKDFRDEGITRMRADGTLLPSVRPPNATLGLASWPGRETSDLMLIGHDEMNMTIPWARDLVTGRERSFGVPYSSIQGWRTSQPRGLVSVFTSPGVGYTALWDDETGATTTVLDRQTSASDFEPAGRRIVASVSFDKDDPGHLVLIDESTLTRSTITGTENASWVRWITSGIVYTTRPPHEDFRAPPVTKELRVVSPSGGASRVLFKTQDELGVPRLVRAG